MKSDALEINPVARPFIPTPLIHTDLPILIGALLLGECHQQQYNNDATFTYTDIHRFKCQKVGFLKSIYEYIGMT